MTTDRWLALIGIVIGLPAFFALFLTSPGWAFVGLIAAMLILIAAWYTKWYLNRSPYEFHEVKLTLEICDSAAKKAILTKTYKICPNFKHLTEIEFKGMASDGPITDFRWNNQAITQDLISSKFGEYRIKIKFPVSLRAKKLMDGKLSYVLADAFPTTQESMSYVIDYPTKIAHLAIRFPAKDNQLSIIVNPSLGACRMRSMTRFMRSLQEKSQ